jgi:hypothetical protein
VGSLTSLILAILFLGACSHGNSLTGGASCGWRPKARNEQFKQSTPHVCLNGVGPRYRLVASHFAVGSDLRVDLRAEPLGKMLVLRIGTDGSTQMVIRAGGQVPVAGTGADQRPFATLVTASGGPLKVGSG